jgi:hypothetical protein
MTSTIPVFFVWNNIGAWNFIIIKEGNTSRAETCRGDRCKKTVYLQQLIISERFVGGVEEGLNKVGPCNVLSDFHTKYTIHQSLHNLQ